MHSAELANRTLANRRVMLEERPFWAIWITSEWPVTRTQLVTLVSAFQDRRPGVTGAPRWRRSRLCREHGRTTRLRSPVARAAREMLIHGAGRRPELRL